MSEFVLTRNQNRALAALLTSKSITGAAAVCKLSEKTISRYLMDPQFRLALTQAETELIDDAGRRLIHGQSAALDSLEQIIQKAPRVTDRRLAATAWLDLVLKWRELKNVETRLAALEGEVFNGQRNTPLRSNRASN